jgi:hypothetical protein
MHPPALLSVSRMSSHLGSRLWDIYFSALKGECSAIAEQVRAFQRFPLMLANRLNVTLHTFGSLGSPSKASHRSP